VRQDADKFRLPEENGEAEQAAKNAIPYVFGSEAVSVTEPLFCRAV